MGIRETLVRALGGQMQSPPRNAFQSPGGGLLIRTSDDLEDALRGGSISASGQTVNADSAMRVGAVYASVRIIAGAVATLPLHIKRRVDERTREDASDTALWNVLRRKPNSWQTPSQFRRMMQAQVLLRGNGYARIVRTVSGDVQGLIPLHPDQVEVRQRADLKLDYIWLRADGQQQTFAQRDILHLVGLTLNGITGVTPITYARETIGLSLAQERHGANMFRNGAQVGGLITTEQVLGDESIENMKAALEAYRSDGEEAGKVMVLDGGLNYSRMALTAEDAQWLESRKFSRADIAMFFGVPPHMIGDTEKSTSWGTGIEQQSLGFIAYTLEDHLTMWEEAINRDCVPADDETLYARFNRSALVKGDIKGRFEAYATGRRMKVLSANDVRALEDMNQVEGGDIYENPDIDTTNKDLPNES
jgi:HK97 family phage portal protein